MGPEDTFVDLGSGRGRVVLHAALKTDVGAAWGVELSKLRHIHAEDAYYEMEKRGGYCSGTTSNSKMNEALLTGTPWYSSPTHDIDDDAHKAVQRRRVGV